MNPVPIGTTVRVVRAEPFDDYTVGQEVVVHQLDPRDNTFRGRIPSTGKVGGWLNWDQVARARDAVGWGFLEKTLGKSTLELLAAFDGTKELRLKAEVADAILLGLPDLEARVREEAMNLASGSPRLRRRKRTPQPEPTRARAEPAPGPAARDSDEDVVDDDFGLNEADEPDGPDQPDEDDDLSDLFAAHATTARPGHEEF